MTRFPGLRVNQSREYSLRLLRQSRFAMAPNQRQTNPQNPLTSNTFSMINLHITLLTTDTQTTHLNTITPTYWPGNFSLNEQDMSAVYVGALRLWSRCSSALLIIKRIPYAANKLQILILMMQSISQHQLTPRLQHTPAYVMHTSLQAFGLS